MYVSTSMICRFHKFDHNYMRKWLLREQPEEKLDLRLWQTFRNIDLQTAIKLHEKQPGTTAANAPNRPTTILAVVDQPDTENPGSRKTSIVPVMSVLNASRIS